MARRTDGSDAPMLSVLTFNTGLTEIRLFGAALYEDVPHVVPRAAHLAPALRSVDADIVLLQELVPQRVKKELAAELRDLYPHRAGIDGGHPLLRHRAAHSLAPSDRRGFVQAIREPDIGGRPLRPARDAGLHGTDAWPRPVPRD